MFEEAAKTALRFTQCFIHQFSVGDVALAALHSDLSAEFIAERAPGRRHPLHAAFAGDHAILFLETAAGEQQVPVPKHTRLVVAVYPVDGAPVLEFRDSVSGKCTRGGIGEKETFVHVIGQHHLLQVVCHQAQLVLGPAPRLFRPQRPIRLPHDPQALPERHQEQDRE